MTVARLLTHLSDSESIGLVWYDTVWNDSKGELHKHTQYREGESEMQERDGFSIQSIMTFLERFDEKLKENV